MLTMDTHIYRAFAGVTEDTRARRTAERIYVKVQTLGARQVRLYRGTLLTYPYPAKRGYGTRGVLVGVYTVNIRLEWIEEDLVQLLTPVERES